jgi:hypothetical protein
MTSRPHPSATPALSLAIAPSLAGGPRQSAPSPRLWSAIDAIAAGRRPASSPRHYSSTSKTWRLAALSLCACPELSRHPPFARAIPSQLCAIIAAAASVAGAHHLAPPSPSRPPIKGPPRAPDFTASGLSHSIFLFRTQSSSTPSSLPSPVSSALPPSIEFE